VKICIYHPNDPYIAIKSRSEVPLMQPRKVWLCRIRIACHKDITIKHMLKQESNHDIPTGLES
jgi:hypothetical protein